MKLNYSKYLNQEMYDKNAEGQMLNFVDSEKYFANDELLAEGSASAPAQKSRPIIIKVTNTTTSDIANVILLDVNNRVAGGGTFSGVTIASGIPNKTYIAFLYELMSKPFRNGETMLVCSNASQLNETIQVEYTQADGKDMSEVLIFEKDPYQNLTDRVLNKIEWDVNPSTKLTVSSLLGSAVLYIYLYPSKKRDVGQFGSRPVETEYADPKIVKAIQRG